MSRRTRPLHDLNRHRHDTHLDLDAFPLPPLSPDHIPLGSSPSPWEQHYDNPARQALSDDPPSGPVLPPAFSLSQEITELAILADGDLWLRQELQDRMLRIILEALPIRQEHIPHFYRTSIAYTQNPLSLRRTYTATARRR